MPPAETNAPNTDRDGKPRAPRKALMLAAKLVVFGLVVAFVSGSVRDAWAQLSLESLRVDGRFLGLSAAVYLVALAPMAWFWRRVVKALAQPCRWADIVPAYYLGHLGKYVPGKAMVVVLRTGALMKAGGQASAIAISVFVETLTMMAVGGAIASVLLLLTRDTGAADARLVALSLALALVAGAPTAPPVLTWLASRLNRDAQDQCAPRVSWQLVGKGWLAATLTWLGLGMSIWLALRSLSADVPLDLTTLLRCVLAAALPVVAGFLSLLPGGLIVRDGLMFALLKPISGLDEPTALAATALVRLTWVGSEVFACVMLDIGRRLWRSTEKPSTA